MNYTQFYYDNGRSKEVLDVQDEAVMSIASRFLSKIDGKETGAYLIASKDRSSKEMPLFKTGKYYFYLLENVLIDCDVFSCKKFNKLINLSDYVFICSTKYFGNDMKKNLLNVIERCDTEYVKYNEAVNVMFRPLEFRKEGIYGVSVHFNEIATAKVDNLIKKDFLKYDPSVFGGSNVTAWKTGMFENCKKAFNKRIEDIISDKTNI